MAKLRPLNDLILVEPEPPPAYNQYKQFTHIVVPDKFEHGPEDRPVWGKILSIGKLCKANNLEVGDRIVFGKYAGARVQHDNKQIILVREEEILAIDE